MKLSRIVIPHTSLRLNVLVVCETVLLLFLSLAVLLYFSRQALKDEAFRDAEEMLNGTVQHVDNILLSVEQTGYNICEDLQHHLGDTARMTIYCREAVENNPYISGCAVAFRPHYIEGRVMFMTYVRRNASGQNRDTLITSDHFGNRPYTEQVWYTAPMSSGRASWTDPLSDVEGEGVTLSLSLPIYLRAEKDPVGVISFDVPVAAISEIILESKPFRHSYSVMLGRDGTFIVHPNIHRFIKETLSVKDDKSHNDENLRHIIKAMMAGESGHTTFRQNDKDWLVFYKPFLRDSAFGLPIDNMGWSTGMVYLEDDVVGNHELLSYLVLAITVAGVLVFFVLCRLLIRQQMKPLRLLTRSARRVAEGHYDEIVPNAESSNEIGQLQNRFQQMQRSLVGKSAELEKVTRMLTLHGEELRRAYGNAQGSDRMKTTFLHYMTTQMTVPSDLIERSVTKLCNNYNTIRPDEADYEVSVIKKQCAIVVDLLDHMIEALKNETVEQVEPLNERKEDSHECI
jgi:methyl-accepting chemotaxis protein/sigma-B regulation protein RsbU (phosphoserine phosphatase)